jgi:hypothetical protein
MKRVNIFMGLLAMEGMFMPKKIVSSPPKKIAKERKGATAQQSVKPKEVQTTRWLRQNNNGYKPRRRLGC